MANTDSRIMDIANQIVALGENKSRVMIGIAGPPASGKSTIAENLNALIEGSVVVPMDGFHLDNNTLDEMRARDRKGAPHTFDAAGFVTMVEAIARADGPVHVPEFDRSIDAVADKGRVVSPDTKYVLVEGNYLLLNEAPWDQLPPLFDKTIFITPTLEELERRLIERWLTHGFSREGALEKASLNDLPNAKTVVENSSTADIILSN